MKTLTANEAKTNFGELLMTTQREPVAVTKNGRPAAVVVSHQDFQAMAQAVETASSLEQFPNDHAAALTRVLSVSSEKMEQGEYLEYQGSLAKTLQAYRASRHDA